MTRTGNTVAVIGLGVMGAPMAANLIDAGYDVVGFNRSPGKVETHVARGGRGASSIAEAVEGADVVLTVLPDTPDVDLAVTGEDGVFGMRNPARCGSTRAPSALTLRSVSPSPAAGSLSSRPRT
jgi:3-hydroxyisobutyrate dehydrogenase-like beta-hydroxyacid dehydrogenase